MPPATGKKLGGSMKQGQRKINLKNDALTTVLDTLQEGQVNGRAAEVAGEFGKQYAWVCEKEGYVTVREIVTAEAVHRITRKGIFPWSVAEGTSKRTVWVGYSNGTIYLHNSEPPFEEVAVLEAGSMGGCYCLWPHLHYIFAGYGNCQIVKWNCDTREREGYFIGHTAGKGSAIRALRLHLTTLFSGADDRTIRSWDINTFEQKKVMKGHEGTVLAIAYTKKNHVWSGGEDSMVKVWKPDTAKCIKTFHLNAPVGVLRFMGNRVWCGCWDKTITLFDAVTLEKAGVYLEHTAPITNVLCVGTTKIFKVWTCGTDKSIKVWNMESYDAQYAKEGLAEQEVIFRLQSRLELFEGRNRRRLSVTGEPLEEEEEEVAGEPAPPPQVQVAPSPRRLAGILKRRDSEKGRGLAQVANAMAAGNMRLRIALSFHWWVEWCEKRRLERHRVELGQALAKNSIRGLRSVYFQKLRNNASRSVAMKGRRHLSDLVLCNTDNGLRRVYYMRLLGWMRRRKEHRVVATRVSLLLRTSERGMLKVVYDRLARYMLLGKVQKRRRELGETLMKMSLKGMRGVYFSRWREWASRKAKIRNRGTVCEVFRRTLRGSFMRVWYDKWRSWAKKTARSRRLGACLLSTTRRGLLQVCFQRWLRYGSSANNLTRKLVVRRMEGFATRPLVHRYYNRLRGFATQRRQRALRLLLSSRMGGFSSRVLLQRYFASLKAFRSKRITERVFISSENLHKEIASLKTKLLEARESAHKAMTEGAESARVARALELRQSDLQSSNSQLRTQVKQLQQELDEAQGRLKHLTAGMTNRPKLLEGAAEVYRYALAIEKGMRAFQEEVTTRRLTRTELTKEGKQLHDKTAKVMSLQREYIQRFFTEDEKLKAGVSTLLYGKDQDLKAAQHTPPERRDGFDHEAHTSRASHHSNQHSPHIVSPIQRLLQRSNSSGKTSRSPQALRLCPLKA
eukprot:Sspe_Gene.80643::Locus_51018_Transcript_1_1_Confidence_1.000_Length_3039::g.80643::m.80643